MQMHPITFTKQHPVAVFGSMAIGYMVLPYVLGQLRGYTGIGVRLPQYGGSE